MSLTIVLVTLVIFLVGVAVGWRSRHVASLFMLIILVLVFAAIDLAIAGITLWPVTYWVLVDLIALQVGYLVGAALGLIVADQRKSLEPPKPS